jgi:hypothetical protein
MTAEHKAVSNPKEFGILAGVSFTKLKYFSGADYFKEADFPLSTKFSAGVFYNLVFPRNFGRSSVGSELIYYAFNSECYYNNAVTTTIQMNYAMLNLLYRFKYPLKKVDLFLKSGVSLGFGFKGNGNLKFEDSGFQDAHEEVAFGEMNKGYLGVDFGFGLKHGKYSVETRCMLGLKKSDFLPSGFSIASRTSALFLMLGYQF